MSRYDDGDWDDEDFPGQFALAEANAERAWKGKRGRQALRDLREALMALPDMKLIARALCTVNIQSRKEPDPGPRVVPDPQNPGQTIEVRSWVPYSNRTLDEIVTDNGTEGVCAVGAYAWWMKVKAGKTPEEAFAELPTLPDTDGDGMWETEQVGVQAGLVQSIAWRFAYLNDETWEDCTPEERFTKFIEWIDDELGAVTS